jgi:hypothetical protein
LRSEVLPDPEGPVRKWNEPGSMRNERSLRISGPFPYLMPKLENSIKPQLSESVALHHSSRLFRRKAATGWIRSKLGEFEES